MPSIFCGEFTLVNHGVEQARAITLKCRAWTCDLCQPDRKRQLSALAGAGNPTVFITLTSNPAVGLDPLDRARKMVEAWRVVIRRCKRRHGYQTIPYFCVFEATKAGEPHLHILARISWIDQKWLSAQMADLTGSPVVDVRKIRSARMAAAYVTKYVGKAPQKFGTLKRYWFTRGWEVDPYQPEPDDSIWSNLWTITRKSLDVIQADWAFQGWSHEMRGKMLHGWGDVPLWGRPRGACDV